MFVVWKTPKEGSPKLKVTVWDPREDTFCEAEAFCGNCVYRGCTKFGNSRFECLGHGPVEGALVGGAQMPSSAVEPRGAVVAALAGVEPAVVGIPLRGEPGPSARPDRSFDYWEPHPGRGAWARVHVDWRTICFRPRKRREGPRWLPWPRRESPRCCMPTVRLMCCGIVGVSRVQGCERLACGSAPRGSSWPGLTRSRAR